MYEQLCDIDTKTQSCFISEKKDNFYDDKINDVFLNHPALEVMANPITIPNIQQHQFTDDELNRLQQQQPNRFPICFLQERPIIESCSK